MANRPCKNCIHEEACKTANPDMVKKTYQCKHYKSTAAVEEVKRGYWIDKPSGRYLHIASWCSVCGNKSGIGGIESNRHKPYCPNCGAKMNGGESDE